MSTKICPYCGATIPADSVFCPNCGAKLTGTSPQAVPPPPAPPASSAPSVPPATSTPVPPQTAPSPTPTMTPEMLQTINPKEPILAAILSFILPGIGQIYVGNVKKGIIFLILAIVLYILLWPLGLIFALYTVYDAYKMATIYNETGQVPQDLFLF